ncbi:MAG: MmcQ/YjbR family DNA-binding protein [Bacteroidetes bacterium]|nr:MmcQ/YjbR family DNA-binding protein [Bacteroidota bacterium]
MDIIEFRDYCICKPLVSEELPFGPDTLVFKVGGKMFALCDLENFSSINLKCNPEYAAELRTNHPEIIPGYHMNKQHWNTVSVQGNLSDKFICELIDHSYKLVFKSLPKKIRDSVK